METPSSARRVTRSQTLAVLNSNHNIPISRKMEDSGNVASKSRQRNAKQQQQQDRSALIDITNDSPIGGLAMGSLYTPSSGIAKQRNSIAKNSSTPGSGEALLRGQVKTLLQKVEEEAEVSKLSLQCRPFLHLQGPVNSPMLAPTPANTPNVPDLSDSSGFASESPLAVVEEQLISQVVSDIFDGNKLESLESQKSLTRSLMLDFSEKSESPDSSECSSVLTECKQKPNQDDDDDASIWSIQVNASTHDEDERVNEESEVEDGEEDEDYYYEEGDDDEGSSVDALCEGFSKMGVMDTTNKFAGKHIRFVYDSDGEIAEECVESEDSGSVLRLKGLPTPKGKHIRFNVEEEEEDN